jgi:hypothetical protein
MEHSGKVLGEIMIQGFAGKCEIKLCSQALHNLYGRGTELLSLGMVSFLSISLTLSLSLSLSLSFCEIFLWMSNGKSFKLEIVLWIPVPLLLCMFLHFLSNPRDMQIF